MDQCMFRDYLSEVSPARRVIVETDVLAPLGIVGIHIWQCTEASQTTCIRCRMHLCGKHAVFHACDSAAHPVFGPMA